MTRLKSLLKEIWKEKLSYLFILPDLIIFSVFIIIPVFYSLYLSFHKWNILDSEKPFVGLANYANLFKDEFFIQALWNTVYFVGLNVPIMLGLALLVALLLNNKIKGIGLFRTLYFLPVVTSMVVAAVTWRWIYNGDFGYLNFILMKLHILKEPIYWLADIDWAMPAVVFVNSWKGIGFYMIIFLAGLQGIPSSLYEAADIDGASKWRQFWSVTFPLLKPTTFFAVIMAVIGSFQVFTSVYVMTHGGPLRKTVTIVTYLYDKAFRDFQMGYASAMSYVLFAIIFVFTILQYKKFADVDY